MIKSLTNWLVMAIIAFAAIPAQAAVGAQVSGSSDMTQADKTMHCEYTLTYNADKTITLEADITTDAVGIVPQLFFYAPGEQGPVNLTLTDGKWIGTTPFTFEDGAQIEWRWYVASSVGLFEQRVPYTVGSGDTTGGSGEEPEQPTEPEQPEEPNYGAVWYGITDINGFYAEYNITYNADKTITVRTILETEKKVSDDNRNFFIHSKGEWLKLKADGQGGYIGTSESTFEAGESYGWRWYMAVDGGLYQKDETYVAGSSNEKPATLRIEASYTNLASESATLIYTVKGADTYTVYYKAGEGEFIEAPASPIELTGLTPSTAYTYEFYAAADGLESVHKTVSFTTVAEGVTDLVYYDIFETTFTNAWRGGENPREDIHVKLLWSITYKTDGTAIYAIDLSEVENLVGIVPKLWCGDYYDLVKNPETGWWEHNFGTKKIGDSANLSHYIPYDGGGIDSHGTPYTKWGMTKEKPLTFSIKATAEDINFDSAKIAYTVNGAEEYTVYYKAGDGEFIEATASPIELTGLTENTTYTYELYITAEFEGELRESEHITVEFKTPYKDAVDLVFSDILNAEFKNAWIDGEPEANRHTVYAAIPWSITYRKDGTAIYEVDLTPAGNIVGMVPQIWWDGGKSLTKNPETGKWYYEFGEQELDAEVHISHLFAYNGGSVDVNFHNIYPTWGLEHEAPVLGEAASLQLSISASYVKLGDAVTLALVAKDAAGYYLPLDGITFEAEFNGEATDLAIEGSKFVLAKNGTYTIKAKSGDLTSNEVKVNGISIAPAENVLAKLEGAITGEHIQAGNVSHITDGNLGTEFIWSCKETEQHAISYDFGSKKYVDAVHIVFEGAYAKSFTVTLSNVRPELLEAGSTDAVSYALRAPGEDIDAEDAVYVAEDIDLPTVNNGNGAEAHHIITADNQKSYQYLTLETSKALNTTWGIKLKQISVYATDAAPEISTGIADVTAADSEAAVEYYNLSGIRVANPSAGVYIKRQGSKVSKVLVK